MAVVSFQPDTDALKVDARRVTPTRVKVPRAVQYPSKAQLILPPGVVSHTPQVTFTPARRITHAIRREILRRYEQTRADYPHVRAFAVAESKYLAQHGIFYRANAIEVLISRRQGVGNRCHPVRQYKWEHILARFRKKNPRHLMGGNAHWYDMGDFPEYRTRKAFIQALKRLRNRGYQIKTRPTSFDARVERGWWYEYRLMEEDHG